MYRGYFKKEKKKKMKNINPIVPKVVKWLCQKKKKRENKSP